MISLWLPHSPAPQGNAGNRGTRIHIICRGRRFIFWPAWNPWADSELSHRSARPMHTHHWCPCKESRFSLALSTAALPLKITITFCQSCDFQHKILLQPRFPSCSEKQSSRCSVPDGYLCVCLCAQLGAAAPLSDPSSVQVCAHPSLAGDRCYFIQETLGLQ